MTFDQIITKSILQIRDKCQFFGALMLFAKILPSEKITTAATNGKEIVVNKDFLNSLNSSEQNALLLHEVLHMALLHCLRIGSRDRGIWNIAADIVVNNLILLNTPFALPKGCIIDKSYKGKSVEYIYEDLLKNNRYKKKKYKLLIPDILQGGGGEDEKSSASSMTGNEKLEVETFWKDAMQVVQNTTSSSSNSQGNLPLGISQEIQVVLEPEVDWRHALWKYVGKTNSDFDELDRRFIYRGLYLEGLLTEGLEIFVCIDTSASVSPQLLDQFFAELKGILSSYPHVKCKLFYADTEIYGPYELESIEELPEANGFGGTSFVPFFNYLEKTDDGFSELNRAAVYFTDGYGDFPAKEAENPTLWLVPLNGLETSSFPFGEVIRISSDG